MDRHPIDAGTATATDRHAELHAAFVWQVPSNFNIAEACCRRWARGGAAALPAIIWETEQGTAGTLTYGELQTRADRLSRQLRRCGVATGDRVAIVLPQRPATAVAHIALYQIGAVAMPLSMLFGPEALSERLKDSGAVLALIDHSAVGRMAEARRDCPALRTLLTIGPEEAGSGEWHLEEATADGSTADGAKVAGGRADADSAAESVASANTDANADADGHAAADPQQGTDADLQPDTPFEPADTAADDPAILIYTSGTTGPPKGALIPHRALLGNLSGFVCSQNGFGSSDDEIFWSPADWAWTGGLMDALLPTLYFGRPIVAFEGRFTPERAFDLMERHAVTHTFLFPTALKAMMKALSDPRSRHVLCLRGLMSAGEAVGGAVFDWCQQALDVGVNEMFGQTEVNYIVGNCGRHVDSDGTVTAGWPARAGSMGRAYPGHRVAVIDDDGQVCPPGTPGDVALHRLDVHGHPDPVFFLGYWNQPAATAAKFTGDPADSWCRTGDTAVMDADGYLWHQGRSDDIFKAAGYRIGPSEVENCLVGHAAVALAAVVPKPDPERGAVVKAYVVLAPGHTGDEALVRELQQHVRARLAPYEYPKEIEFIDALPMTTTGKVQRRVLRLREEELSRARAASPPTAGG